MFNPTVELKEVVDGALATVLTKEIVLTERGFPEVLLWKDAAYAIVDWEENLHAVYEKTTSLVLTYEPKSPDA